jgi:hypothetical protein
MSKNKDTHGVRASCCAQLSALVCSLLFKDLARLSPLPLSACVYTPLLTYTPTPTHPHRL